MSTLPKTLNAPVILSTSSLDNTDNDTELLTISSTTASSTVYPSYVKLIVDNVSRSNSLSQLVVNLKNDDYTYTSNAYLISVSIPITTNNNFTVLAKVFYSDGTSTPYSLMKAFTSGPTTPVILSAYGDAKTSIFMSITPQPEVTSYSAILGYVDYNSNQKLDVLDGIITTDSSKQFIELKNLLQNVQYNISLTATNANGQSQISNTISSTTKPQPDPVTDFVSSFNQNGDIMLSWTPPLNSIHIPVAKYRLQTNWGEFFIDGLLSSYTFYSQSAVGLRYNYKLSAIHSDLNDTNKDLILEYESVSVSTSVFLPETSEVQNLTASIDSSTLAITLTWSAPTNNDTISTDSYDIMFDGLFYQNITATSIVYSLTRPGGVYSFQIIPLHGLNKSSQSKSINVQIPVAGAPVNLTSAFDASCNVILNWSLPSNNSSISTTSYNIYDASETLIVSTSALTYTFQNQISGQSYAYTVKSMHGSFEGSGASTSVAIPVPAPAVSLVSAFDTTGAISLTWNYPQTMVNIDNFAVFDIANNVLSPSIPASPSTANYFFSMGNAYPLGASYSFYVLSYNKGVASQASMQTTVALPVPSAPLSLIVTNNPTTPPNASLSWLPPSNNNIISTDSYNLYQDGVLVHNVVQGTFNSGSLVAGNTYSFVVKPLHGSVEFNSPVSASLKAYQQSSAPVSFVAQPKNNSVILTWQNPVNTGGLVPSQFNLSYVADNGQTTQSNIMYSTTGAYYQTITGLTNKTSYNFSLFLITGGQQNGPVLNGQVSSISTVPTGLPLITAISFASKTLTASVDGNGSALLSNFMIISFDSQNMPTVNQYSSPSFNTTTGLYSINQLLPASAVKASLIVANSAGIASASSWQ